MDTIFDNPRWSWRLRRKDADLGNIGNHDVWTAIVIPGSSEPEILARVELMPPSQAFFFLRQRGVAALAETYFHIVVRGKRAYCHLHAHDVDSDDHPHQDWALFYWTRSNAPKWLKKHL